MRSTMGSTVAALCVAAAVSAGAQTAPGPSARLAPMLRTDTIANLASDRSGSVVYLHTVIAMKEGGPAVDEGLGSGVVVDTRGSIVTNAHVVADAAVVHVRLPDGRDVDARVIAADAEADLALLRMDGPALLPLAPLGDSAGLRPGEWVAAIGNPLGLYHTVTLGIVSAVGRMIDGAPDDFLQTDAAINAGSSGGGLFNLRGELVGVTSGMLSRTGENAGLNLAIPVNRVKAFLARVSPPVRASPPAR